MKKNKNEIVIFLSSKNLTKSLPVYNSVSFKCHGREKGHTLTTYNTVHSIKFNV